MRDLSEIAKHQQVVHKLFNQRESGDLHAPYQKEFEYYECVKRGDTKTLKTLMNELGGKGAGVLSKDPLQNIKYHFVISVAFITRFCVEGGLEMELAYNLSDYYINLGDEAKTIDEVQRINKQMGLDFATQMKRLTTKQVYSKQATKCIEYIFNNLHSRLTLSEIAQQMNLSESYLSRTFHKEVGVTISEYIQNQRIEAAKNMLKFSEYQSQEISDYLCFSSHSHFISVFKKKTGLTPAKYRDKHFRADWTTNEYRIKDKNR